uniref:Uncharacterized protein n=1 Tax=Phaselicystis flava TaxID=525924 RepID=A0A3S7V0B0_9BACT|nr:hypothetical protein [Phaselicystis flava]
MSNDASDDPTFTPEEEAFIQAEIARAMKPYLGVAPPQLLATMRATLEEQMRTHPVMLGMMKQLVARKPVDRSGDVPNEAVPPDAKAGGEDER